MGKIKRAKGISIVLLFMMVFQLVMPVNLAYGDTFDIGEGDPGGDNVILSGTTSGAAIKAIDIKLEFKDSSGEVVDHKNNPVPVDASVKLRVRLDFIDIETDESDDPGLIDTSKTYSIKLADQMSISQNKTIDIYHPDLEFSNVKLATATIKTDGTVDIVFLPEINDFDTDRFLWFEADGKMDKSKLGSGGDQELEFEVLGKTENVDITFEPIEEKVTLTKAGSWDTEKNEITWTITAKAETKPSGGTVKNIVIEDTLGTGQTFLINDFGSSGVTYNSATNKYDFGDIKDGHTKSIKIVTKPDLTAFTPGDEDKEVKLYNTVKGTFGNNNSIPEVGAEAKTTVNFINKKDGQFIAGATRDGDIITWTVEINNNNLVMPAGTTLKDNMPTGLELITESLKINSSPASSFSGANVTSSVGGFTIIFNGGLTQKAIVTYSTRITDINAYDPTKTAEYENTATLEWNSGSESLDDKGTVGIGRAVIGKSGNGYDATDKREVKWYIKVNEYRLNMKNPEVTDTLPVELEYVSSIVPDGWTVTTGTAVSGGKTVQTITFSYAGDTASRYDIYVVTRVKDEYKDIYGANKTTTFTNNVSLEATNIDKTSTSANQNYISKVIAKSNEGYNYLTRVASWKIVVNQNKMTVNNAVITDTIGDYHEFVEGSLKLAGGTLTKVDGEPEVNQYSVNGKVIKINLGKITGEKTITYETKIPDEELENIFGKNSKTDSPKISNTATITGDTIKGGGQTVTAEKKINNSLVSKNSNYSNGNDFIEWSVEVNLNQLDFGDSDVKLEDTLQSVLILDKNSVKLYKLSMKADGTYNETDAVLVPDKVGVDYNVADNKVVFDLGNINNEAYLLKFTTDIDGDKASNVSISNTITLKGTAKIGDSSTKNLYVSFDNSTGGGGGSKTKGSIRIIKEDDYNNTISGVKFELLDKDKKSFTPAKIGTTDDSGVVYFNDLSMTTYWVKELGAPDGYIMLNEYTTVTLKKGLPTGDHDPKNPEVTIINQKIVKDAIQVVKVDNLGNVLPGTEFGIYAKSAPSTLIKPGTSDANGVVLFENMAAGEYLIKEISSVDGYLKSTAVVYVKAEKHTDSNLKVTYGKDGITYSEDIPKFENTSIDIELIKKNDRDILLPGAEFTLYDSSGNKVGESVLSGSTIPANSNGNVVFKGIKPGKYTVKETEFPDGYIQTPVSIGIDVKVNDDGTVKTITFDGYDDNQVPTIENKLDIKDDVVIIKIDTSDRPLVSVKFGLYRDGELEGAPIDTQYSGEDGVVRFNNIAEGSYIIKEVEAPAGYIKSGNVIYVRVDRTDDNKAKVEYSSDGKSYSNVVPKFENDSINIEFNKEDNNNKPLAGAEFTLYNSEGAPILKGGEIVTASSDDDGKIIFTAIPAGTYIIKETKAPSGYRNYEKEITAVVSVNGTVVFTVDEQSRAELTVVNVKKPSGGGEPVKVYGKATVKKVDEGKKALAGAEFTLYDSNGKVVGRAVTGSDGTVSFEELEPGDYVLKETKAPEGYVLDEKETDVTISGSQTKSYTLTNKKEEPKKPGSIEIIKTDEDGKALSGARFALVDDKGATLQTVDTVNGRAVFEDVLVGKYTVKEIQAPDGYELSTRTISVTVESEKTITVRFENRLIDKPTTPVDPNNPVVPEGPKAGSISITKVDENSMALPGAEFTLYNEDNQIIGTAVSDVNGRVMFENLKEGTYYVEETNAPEGYVLVDDVLVVDVTETRTYSYRFKNVPESMLIEDPNIPLGWETIEDPDVPTDTVKPADKLPDTGSIVDTWLLAVIGLIFILAGAFMYRRRVLN